MTIAFHSYINTNAKRKFSIHNYENKIKWLWLLIVFAAVTTTESLFLFINEKDKQNENVYSFSLRFISFYIFFVCATANDWHLYCAVKKTNSFEIELSECLHLFYRISNFLCIQNDASKNVSFPNQKQQQKR